MLHHGNCGGGKGWASGPFTSAAEAHGLRSRRREPAVSQPGPCPSVLRPAKAVTGSLRAAGRSGRTMVQLSEWRPGRPAGGRGRQGAGGTRCSGPS